MTSRLLAILRVIPFSRIRRSSYNIKFSYNFVKMKYSLLVYDGSDLKTYLWMRGFGPDVVPVVVRPTRLYLLDFFCSGIQLYVLLSPYLYFIYLD